MQQRGLQGRSMSGGGGGPGGQMPGQQMGRSLSEGGGGAGGGGGGQMGMGGGGGQQMPVRSPLFASAPRGLAAGFARTPPPMVLTFACPLLVAWVPGRGRRRRRSRREHGRPGRVGQDPRDAEPKCAPHALPAPRSMARGTRRPPHGSRWGSPAQYVMVCNLVLTLEHGWHRRRRRPGRHDAGRDAAVQRAADGVLHAPEHARALRARSHSSALLRCQIGFGRMGRFA